MPISNKALNFAVHDPIAMATPAAEAHAAANGSPFWKGNIFQRADWKTFL